MPVCEKIAASESENRPRFFRLFLRGIFILALLFIPVSKTKAQTIYVTDAAGNIYSVNLATCASTLVLPTTGLSWYDLAVCSNNPSIMYGVDGNNTLYQINLLTGVVTFLNGSFNAAFPTFSLLNSLVCDGNGNLYAADAFGNGLFCYNLATNTWTFTGSLGGYGSAGDLTFYNGNLYLATASNELLEISLSPLFNVSVNPMSASGMYGILTTSTASLCTTGTTTMLGMSGNDVYTVDPLTGNCTILCPGVVPAASGPIYGAASLFEGTIPPNVTLTATAGDTTLCTGQNTTLTASGATTYNWQPGNLSGSSITVSPAATTTYSVIGSDPTGCSDTAYVTITVSAGLSISGTQQNATCPGSCDASAAIQIQNGLGPFTYVWSNAAPDSSNAFSLCAGNISCQVTDAGGCTDSQTFTITQPPAITSITTIVNDSCFGQCNGSASLNISGGSGSAYSYSWSPQAGNNSSLTNLCSGNYSCLVTDSLGCTANFPVTITQPALLTVNGGTTLNICVGNNAVLTANPNGGTGPYNFLWQPGNLAGQNPVVAPVTNITYSVVLTDNNGCTANSTQTVNVNPLPNPVFVASDSSGCAPLCVTFTSPTQSSDVCTWDFGDGNTLTGNAPVNHCYNSPGTFTVSMMLTDSNGCSGTIIEPNLITVFPSPFASFTFSPDYITIYDPSVLFTDHSIGADSWLWDFGDTVHSTSFLQDPAFTYADTGCFNVTLTASNLNGCSDDTTQEVCIFSEFTFYIPNSFTPNGNGLNDMFLPFVNGYQENSFHMMIFDRWGNLIFESHDPLDGWNGKVQDGKSGKVCQIDTYVWVINVNEWNGVEHEFRGHVNLIH